MPFGFSEILFIFVLALLLFGPRRLPEIARQTGKALAEFRRASNEVQRQLQEYMRKLEQEADVKSTVTPGSRAAVDVFPVLYSSSSMLHLLRTGAPR